MKTVVALLLSIFLFNYNYSYSQQNQGLKLHSPKEIISILETSTIKYEVEELTTDEKQDYPLMSNQLYLDERKEGHSLMEYKLDDNGRAVFEQANNEFSNKNYKSALELYESLYVIQPNYNHALTLIGDVYYCMDEYEKAEKYFRKSIEINFADYNAHWFLADTYSKLKKFEEALIEVETAHLLNRNHKDLKKILKRFRLFNRSQWVEWDFIPQYDLYADDEGVIIKAKPGWFGYAMVKALWKYEPGYAESMGLKKDNKELMLWWEEMEAIYMASADTLYGKKLEEIAEAGYINEFILYEIFGLNYPQTLILLPRENFIRVLEYIRKFH